MYDAKKIDPNLQQARYPQLRLYTSFQSIPQYIEVPPNIEAKQIVSYFSTVLFYQSKPALLKDDSKLLIFQGCWQATCNYNLHDPGHHPNEGPS